MNCPICAAAELELLPGKQKLGGLLVKPNVLACPQCGTQFEQRREKLRFLHIPSPYAMLIGDGLEGWSVFTTANDQGAQAREFLQYSHELAAGTQQPCEVDCAANAGEPGESGARHAPDAGLLAHTGV